MGQYRVVGAPDSVVAADGGPQFSTAFTLKLLDMVQSLQDENHRLKQNAASAAGSGGGSASRNGTAGDRGSNIPKEFVIDDLEEQLNTTTSAYEGKKNESSSTKTKS